MPVKSSASFRMTALPMVVTAQLLAAAVLTLTLVWVLHFRGGVSWKPTSNPLFVYTAHPLFMVIGFIICTGEGKGTNARLQNSSDGRESNVLCLTDH